MKLIIGLIFIFQPTLVLAKKSNVSTENGRFQLIQLSDMRRDQYLLDTQTGKTWTKICVVAGKESSDCSYGVWAPDDVIDINVTRKEVAASASRLIEQQSKETEHKEK